jgi:GNAT superfamily N-acetyltransferase
LPTESSIAQEFDSLRKTTGFIRVPLHLWGPDQDAVAFAWLGRIIHFVVGRTTRSLREGLAPGRFQGLVTQGTAGCRRQVRRWAQALPSIGPTHLLLMIQNGLEAPLAVRTQFRRDGRFDLVFAVGQAGSHDFLALVERRFSLADSVVEHRWLRVDASSQHRGLAARVIGALLPLYEMLGIYTVRITAGLSAGGAVWGKFGFVPDADDWARICPIIQTNIEAVMLRRDIPPTVYEACEAAAWLVKDADPKNLWLISDLAGTQSVDGVRLGSVLLRSVRWRGSLSFADKEAVNRLRDRFALSGVGSTALDSLAAAASRSSP